MDWGTQLLRRYTTQRDELIGLEMVMSFQFTVKQNLGHESLYSVCKWEEWRNSSHCKYLLLF